MFNSFFSARDLNHSSVRVPMATKATQNTTRIRQPKTGESFTFMMFSNDQLNQPGLN